MCWGKKEEEKEEERKAMRRQVEEKSDESEGQGREVGWGGGVCQCLMLSHWDRSTAGLNAALPALGTRGVAGSREIKTDKEEIKWEIQRKHDGGKHRQGMEEGEEWQRLKEGWGMYGHADVFQPEDRAFILMKQEHNTTAQEM